MPEKKAIKIRCPRCRAETAWDDNPSRPFCSERCRLIDLGSWADGEYRIPGRRADDEERNKVVDFPGKHED